MFLSHFINLEQIRLNKNFKALLCVKIELESKSNSTTSHILSKQFLQKIAFSDRKVFQKLQYWFSHSV